MDDSMTSEVVKLMLDELERVRSRNRELLSEIQAANRPPPGASLEPVDSDVHALQQENGRLKAEVEAARIRLEELPGLNRDGYDGDEGFDTGDVGENRAEYSPTSSKALDAGESELIDQVSRAREKYKRHKSSKYELEESVLETQNKIDERVAERQRELPKIEQLQKELQQYGSLLSEAEKALGAAGLLQFDLVDFLRDPMFDAGSAEALEEDVLVPSVSASATGLPNAIANLCNPHGLVMRRSGEVVWPSEPPSRTHCLFFSSTHRYDPTAHNTKGGWTLAWDMGAQQDKTKEVFYLKAQNWFYAGTYECQRQTMLPFSKISVLGKHHKNDLQQRAVMNPDMVAPVLVKMMRDMYDCGALKIVCTGWRCVGFNHKLVDALKSIRDTKAAPGHANQQPHQYGGVSIRVPQEGSKSAAANPGKRGREDTEMASRKKHKKE